jgi:hypothetical protein
MSLPADWSDAEILAAPGVAEHTACGWCTPAVTIDRQPADAGQVDVTVRIAHEAHCVIVLNHQFGDDASR